MNKIVKLLSVMILIGFSGTILADDQANLNMALKKGKDVCIATVLRIAI